MATYNASQAARLIGVSERSIHTWLKAGKLHGVKQGREYVIEAHEVRRYTRRASGTISEEALELGTEIFQEALVRIKALEAELSALKTQMRGLQLRGMEIQSRPVKEVSFSPAPPDELLTPVFPPRIPSLPATGIPVESTPRQEWKIGRHGALPEGMVSRTEAAELHGIALTTLRRQVQMGYIETSPETYVGTHGQFSIARPLTAKGMAQFYAWASQRPEFRPCRLCPHTEKITLVGEFSPRERGDTTPLTELVGEES